MLDRAGYQSEITGETTHLNRFLHAAHKDHAKDSAHYNDLENGWILTVKEHMFHHLAYQGKADLIGLTEYANDWAIQRLFEQWQYSLQFVEC